MTFMLKLNQKAVLGVSGNDCRAEIAARHGAIVGIKI